jgi:hypothetical protein
MPNWENFWNDAAIFVNWTIYVGAIVLFCASFVALTVAIVIATAMKIKEVRIERQFRKLDRKHVYGHRVEL